MVEITHIGYTDENPPNPLESAVAQTMHIARCIYEDILRIHYNVQNVEVQWGSDEESGDPGFGVCYEETDDNAAAYLNFIADFYKANNLKASLDDELHVLPFKDLTHIAESLDNLLIRIDAKHEMHQKRAPTDMQPEEIGLRSLKSEFYTSRDNAEDAANYSAANDDVDLLFTFGIDHLRKSIAYYQHVRDGTQAQLKTSDGFHIH